MSGSERDSGRSIERAADLLRPARSILFVTGAGISADSGLPTYRGVGGLYDHDDTEDGTPIEVCLSGPMFRREPVRTWRYIRQIERACRGAEPNAAHRAIAHLERERERVWVLTQNVDGLHVASGSRNVIAIHGDVHRLSCTRCAWTDRVDDFAALDAGTVPDDAPRCPDCGAVIRPDVVLFEEPLPDEALATLRRETRRGFDAVVAIGTTASFPYIVQPVVDARTRGAPTVEINPGASAVSGIVDVRIRAGAAEAMEAVLAAL